MLPQDSENAHNLYKGRPKAGLGRRNRLPYVREGKSPAGETHYYHYAFAAKSNDFN